MTKEEFEIKLEEYLNLMKLNDYNVIDRPSSIKFNDGTNINIFWNNYKNEIYNSVTSGKKAKYYKKNYNECCESIIKMYKKILVLKNKIEINKELEMNLDYMVNNDIFHIFTKRKNCNQRELYNFFKTYSKEIYDIITNGINLNKYEGNYLKVCINLKREYEKYIFMPKKVLKTAFEEKLEIYLKCMIKNNYQLIRSVRKVNNYTFSDGNLLARFWIYNKDKIYESITIGENANYYQRFYEKCCEIIKEEYEKKDINFDVKLEEYLKAMKDNNNKVIKQTQDCIDLKLSTGTLLYVFWYANYKKIYFEITIGNNAKYYQEKYKECCDAIITEINNRHLSFDEKLEEYLCAIRDNGYIVIRKTISMPQINFSDGVSMNNFWFSNRKRIYDTLMNSEDSEYYLENYKECCDVIKLEYYRYLSRIKDFESAKKIFDNQSEYKKLLSDYNLKIYKK